MKTSKREYLAFNFLYLVVNNVSKLLKKTKNIFTSFYYQKIRALNILFWLYSLRVLQQNIQCIHDSHINIIHTHYSHTISRISLDTS